MNEVLQSVRIYQDALLIHAVTIMFTLGRLKLVDSRIFLVISLCLAAPLAAGDDVVEDQSFPGSNSGLANVFNDLQRAQTFPVNTDGILERIDVIFNRGFFEADLFWDVRPVADGVPSETETLASGVILFEQIPEFPDLIGVQLDLSQFSIFVMTGEQYAVTTFTDGEPLGWRLSPVGNPGEKFSRNPLLNQEWVPTTVFPDSGLAFSSFIRNVVVGDVNCDQAIDLLDVAPFVELLATGEYSFAADANGDGLLNTLDIGPFVDLILDN